MCTHSIPFKRCTKCSVEHPATTTHFRKKDRGKYGLYSVCRACERQITQNYRYDHHEKALKATRRWYKENTASIREYQKRYRGIHRETLIKNSQQYNEAHREQQRIATKRWRENNPERRMQYLKVSRNRIRTYSHLRRTRKRGLPNTFDLAQWQRALDYFNGCCAVCGRPPGLWHTLAQDHWIPITDLYEDNPGTVATNIVPMCHSMKNGEGSCNKSKGNKDPIEWLNRKFGKRKARIIFARIDTYFNWVALQMSNLERTAP